MAAPEQRNTSPVGSHQRAFDALLARGTPLHQIEVMLDLLDLAEETKRQEKTATRGKPTSDRLAGRYDVAW